MLLIYLQELSFVSSSTVSYIIMQFKLPIYYYFYSYYAFLYHYHKYGTSVSSEAVPQVEHIDKYYNAIPLTVSVSVYPSLYSDLLCSIQLKWGNYVMFHFVYFS